MQAVPQDSRSSIILDTLPTQSVVPAVVAVYRMKADTSEETVGSKMKDLYIFTIPNGESRGYILNITEPFEDRWRAESRIRTMQYGYGQFDTWMIVTYDRASDSFVTSGGEKYVPTQAGYTDEAWASFRNRIGATK